MNFAQPIWLIAGLAACLLLWWLYRRFDRQQQAALARFVSPHLLNQLTPSVSAGRRTFKHVLVIAGVACLFIALARPQAGYRWEETHRKGLDILFAVDTSKSMLTQDVKPDRLTRAKMAVSDLVDKLDGDDVGLIAFAGDAFLQSPMTQDYDAFRESLDALDTSTIPRGGTDISRAIGEAQTAFQTQNDHDKILILITDGEDLEGNAITAAQAAAKDGVKIFTVGVGTANGDLIPVPNGNGGTDFLRDSSGQFVKSRLDQPMLQKIAAATGGMYEPLGQRGEGLTTIYDRGLAPFQRHDVASREHRVPLEQFEWPLLAGLCCFVADFLIGTRKHQRRIMQAPMSSNAIRFARRRTGSSVSGHSLAAAAAVVVAMIAWPSFAHASPQSAEKAYKQGDFAVAEQQYESAAAKTPAAPQLEFNVGAAAYKAGQFDEAAKAFQKSLTTDQLNLQEETYYNLGNTQYRLGQQTQKSNPQQTIPTWKQAIQSYDAALQLNPKDGDAIYNRALVQKELEKLQQQQKQQQQNKDNKDQKNQDQNSHNQNNQNQNSQNGNKQDQKNQNPSQGKNDQANSNQNNQGQSKQDQNDQGQQNQNQQQQAGKQPNQKADQAKADQPKPDGDKGQTPQQAQARGQPQPPQQNGQAQANGSQPKDGSQAQAAAQAKPVPGQMTPEEARALLDSLKGDEHRLPAAPIGRNQNNDDNTPPAKDW